MSGINLQESEKDIGRVVQAVIQLMQGRSNAVGEVTLRAGQTTTVVDKSVHRAAVNVSKDSQVFLTPITGNAAGSMVTTWISSIGQGTFVINHSNLPSTDRTFGWVALG